MNVQTLNASKLSWIKQNYIFLTSFSAHFNKIKKCDFCEDGKIIIGPHIGTMLTACCNVCDNTYVLKDISTYIKLPKKCEKCQARLIKVSNYYIFLNDSII